MTVHCDGSSHLAPLLLSQSKSTAQSPGPIGCDAGPGRCGCLKKPALKPPMPGSEETAAAQRLPEETWAAALPEETAAASRN
eukprot:355663-Hanusia_phi.AAC.1